MKSRYSNVDDYAKDLWNELGIKQINDDIGAGSLNDLTNSLKNKMDDTKYIMDDGKKDWNAMYNDLITERKATNHTNQNFHFWGGKKSRKSRKTKGAKKSKKSKKSKKNRKTNRRTRKH
tara:strand:- start:3936 stop:4292 length:357 start_codon:yes stop_codon:yes gene_type:complete